VSALEGLCARRGCPEPAVFVPRLEFHGPSSSVLSAPMFTLAHCPDCRKGVALVDDLLGPGALLRAADQFEREGKARPLGGVVRWEPLA
jgi:hypothetical protein